MPLNAEIVTTGTEILLGEIVDTNAAWIAQQLRDVGVNLFYKTTVGDNLALPLPKPPVVHCKCTNPRGASSKNVLCALACR